MKILDILKEELNLSTPTGTLQTATSAQKKQTQDELGKGGSVRILKKGDTIREMARTSVVKYELKPDWKEKYRAYINANPSGALLIEIVARILNSEKKPMFKMDIVNKANEILGRNISPQLFRHYIEKSDEDSIFQQYQQDIRSDFEVRRDIPSKSLDKGIEKGRTVIPKVLGQIDSSGMMTADRKKVIEDLLKYKDLRNKYREDKQKKIDTTPTLHKMRDMVLASPELAKEVAIQYDNGSLKVSDPVTTIVYNRYKDTIAKEKAKAAAEEEPEDFNIEDVPTDWNDEDEEF